MVSVRPELVVLSEQLLVLVAGKRAFDKMRELVALEAKLPGHRRQVLGPTEVKAASLTLDTRRVRLRLSSTGAGAVASRPDPPLMVTMEPGPVHA